ncbi:MAG TPA: ATP synthase F1 subunit delta [Terriglobales bacterium]|nr:ATP synthase F1 subunit delta [Terriglobales bacterium]
MAAVNSRYARAFADVVFDKKMDANQTIDELHTLAHLVESNAPLRTVWESPSVPAEQKRKVLDQIVHAVGASPMTRNLVAVLIDNRRIAALPEIARQFQQELSARLGIADAEIITARDLGDEEKRALEQQITALTGKKVRAAYRRDTKLLGGAVVKVGSTIYDGSVKGQLRRLKEQLSAG